jgi:hypothetical protein
VLKPFWFWLVQVRLHVLEIIGEIGGQKSLKVLASLFKEQKEMDSQTFQGILQSITQIVKRNNLPDDSILTNTLKPFVIDNRQNLTRRLLTYRSLINMGIEDIQSPSASDVARLYLIRFSWIVIALVIALVVLIIGLYR